MATNGSQTMSHSSNSSQDGKPQVNVLVIGAGFAGMTAAIECRLRGMQVTLIEKYNNSAEYGDVIDFFANGGRIVDSWDNGRIADKLLKVCISKAKWMKMLKHTGEHIHSDPWYLKPEHYRYQFAGQRGEMWKVFKEYAEEVGVTMRFGKGVTRYFEESDHAGVVLSDGTELTADCILAGDGPKSLARLQMLGIKDDKTNSGYAIFRSYMEIGEDFRSNPRLQDYLNKEEDIIKFWIGPESHMLAYSWNQGTKFVWVFFHPDDQDIGESWSEPADKNSIRQYLYDIGFNDECKAILEVTPEEKIIDYKLVWRNPIKTWLSSGARIALIGDAAHCHLPTSGQGGSQAMEDAITAAVCLQRSRGDVPLALRVMERIRFNRSHVIHQAGAQIRETWHENSWDQFDEDPEKIALARGDWILDFDAVKNAEEHFEHLAEDIRSGKQGTIEELSLPAGGEYENVKEIAK